MRTGSAQASFDLPGSRDAMDARDESPFQRPLLLTKNECEALKNNDRRVLLLEIPQKDEDTIALLLGSKGDDGVLRVTIPFSFQLCNGKISFGRCRSRRADQPTRLVVS
jgi:hypothetical protein